MLLTLDYRRFGKITSCLLLIFIIYIQNIKTHSNNFTNNLSTLLSNLNRYYLNNLNFIIIFCFNFFLKRFLFNYIGLTKKPNVV